MDKLPGNSIRISWKHGQLRYEDFGGWQGRNTSALTLISKAVEKYRADFADRQFTVIVFTGDRPEAWFELGRTEYPILAFSVTKETQGRVIPMPDFAYDKWPEAGIESYQMTAAAVRKAGQTPPEHPQIFWIGNAETHELRGRMVELSRVHPELATFVPMNWNFQAKNGERLAADRYVSLPDHCRYGMLIDVRGIGWSARLKYLFYANRPVFVVTRPYEEFFYPYMRPFVHYVPVREDLSDLLYWVKAVRGDWRLAAQLARGAGQFADEFLTEDFALAYIRKVLLDLSQPNASERVPSFQFVRS